METEPKNARDGKLIIFESSNPEVASVGETSGMITTQAGGFAVITCRAADSAGVFDSVEVQVYQAAEPKSNIYEMLLFVGQTKHWDVTLNSRDAAVRQLRYYCANPKDSKVITVDESGNITGIMPGEATLCAEPTDAEKKKKVELSVKVQPRIPIRLTSLEVNKQQNTISMNLTNLCSNSPLLSFDGVCFDLEYYDYQHAYHRISGQWLDKDGKGMALNCGSSDTFTRTVEGISGAYRIVIRFTRIRFKNPTANFDRNYMYYDIPYDEEMKTEWIDY